MNEYTKESIYIIVCIFALYFSILFTNNLPDIRCFIYYIFRKLLHTKLLHWYSKTHFRSTKIAWRSLIFDPNVRKILLHTRLILSTVIVCPNFIDRNISKAYTDYLYYISILLKYNENRLSTWCSLSDAFFHISNINLIFQSIFMINLSYHVF